MHVVLVEPQIAPNTGSIIRLCANTGAELHLVEPLGFAFDDARLRRGGLDYHEFASVTIHTEIAEARRSLPGRWFAFSSSGTRRYSDVVFRPDDVLVFGTERTGLTTDVLGAADDTLTIPMRPQSRSLNLANAVSVVVYEAWRQLGFDGAATGADAGRAPAAVEALAPPDPT